MKKIVSILIMVVLFAGCKGKEDSIDGPKKPNSPKEPYFYVEYWGSHWATVDFNKTCTMTITNEKNQEVSYTIGSRNVIIGPVYAGFTAKMTISAPQDGGNEGRISIARNNDHYFTTYGSFSNAKKAETLTYTIQETTGKSKYE